MSNDTRPSFDAGPQWFGHPRGLTILFLTEMWDQFSFFGMRALLVYYMTKQLLIGQAHSSYIYGLYTSFVYFTPLIGGALSDRYLGRKRAVVIGASIMALGHFMMAFEPLFYAALATIALGNGLFLPSLTSQINELYAPGDPRRSTAYSIYYVGINLGAFLAPLICGTVGELYGWHWGFGLAGIGMIVGLVTYLSGSRYLPRDRALARTEGQKTAGTPFATYLLLFCVIAIVVLFRGAYEQSGNTFALWADSGVDRHAGGFAIPMTWFQSLNPLFIFMFTPLIVARWSARARAGDTSGAVSKMAIGAFTVGLSYFLLAALTTLMATVSWLWVVAFFIVYTIGELFILPVGLGLFGRLAPAHLTATAIAAWFMAAFFGNLLAGGVGALWSVMTPAAFFASVGALGGLSGLLLLTLSRWANRTERDAETAKTESDLAAAALATDSRH